MLVFRSGLWLLLARGHRLLGALPVRHLGSSNIDEALIENVLIGGLVESGSIVLCRGLVFEEPILKVLSEGTAIGPEVAEASALGI